MKTLLMSEHLRSVAPRDLRADSGAETLSEVVAAQQLFLRAASGAGEGQRRQAAMQYFGIDF